MKRDEKRIGSVVDASESPSGQKPGHKNKEYTTSTGGEERVLGQEQAISNQIGQLSQPQGVRSAPLGTGLNTGIIKLKVADIKSNGQGADPEKDKQTAQENEPERCIGCVQRNKCTYPAPVKGDQGQLQPRVRPEAFAPKSSRRIEGRADQCRQKPERRMEMHAHQQTEGKQGAYSGDKL